MQKHIRSRTVIQVIMMVFIIGSASLRNSQNSLAGIFPELQGFCPVGAVQSLFSFAADPSLMFRPDRTHVWVISGVMLTTVFFGAVFCSHLCPLGSLQEWIGRAGRKLLKRTYNPPVKPYADKALGSLRYIVIILIAVSTFQLASIPFDSVNPSFALTHIWSAAVPLGAAAVLLVTAVLSFKYERPWCRWLCPYGVILGTLGKISMFKIRRKEHLCIHCGKCDRMCHARIQISAANTVTDTRCNRCSRCIDICPVQGALTSTAPVQGNAAAAAVCLLFLTPLAAARAAEIYIPPGTQSEQVSSFDPGSISPVITVEDLARNMGIEYHTFTELVGLPGDYDGSTMLIDIEEDPEHGHITVGYIREQVVQYLERKE